MVLDVEKESLEARMNELKEAKQKLADHDTESDKLTAEKAEAVLQHKEQLCRLRDAIQAVTEAAIRLIEAESDVAALQERNSGIVERLREEKNKEEALVAETEVAKVQARNAQQAFIAAVENPVNGETDIDRKVHLIAMSEGYTVESIEAEIETENAKLDLIHGADPGVLQEFEKRARDIERSQREKAKKEQQLEELRLGIDTLRGEWEPHLDELIGHINDAFSYNFEQISCAGEVGVHKDEDFDKWAIDIKVKFRYVSPRPPALRAPG